MQEKKIYMHLVEYYFSCLLDINHLYQVEINILTYYKLKIVYIYLWIYV